MSLAGTGGGVHAQNRQLRFHRTRPYDRASHYHMNISPALIAETRPTRAKGRRSESLRRAYDREKVSGELSLGSGTTRKFLALKCGAAPMNSRRYSEQLDGPEAEEPSSPLRSGRTAFSLLEMVVVLMILGVVAAAAMPTFYRSLCYHRLESAARRVKQDLDYLRHTAHSQSATLTCTFDVAALGYVLDEDVLSDPDHGGAYVVELGREPYGMDGLTIDFGDPDTDTLEFNGYGQASPGGTIVVSLGGDDRTISVDATSGEVTIQP
jgi:prepilin-type N-terminal cleavage/methylation domain-containing protein